jgi:hypothetical protein
VVRDPNQPTLFPVGRAKPVPRVRDEVWDALVVVFGEPTTSSNKTLRGRVAQSLREAEATPDEILARAGAWPFHFPGATLTETALEKHWDRLGRPVLRGSVREVERAERRLRIVGGGDG